MLKYQTVELIWPCHWLFSLERREKERCSRKIREATYAVASRNYNFTKNHMKQCINCLSENVSTIVEKNHIFYYCSNCKDKSTKVINNDGENYSVKENGLIKHVTVSALIERGDEILLIDRQKFPHGVGIPSTHLHYEESISDALSRLFLEKIGLNIQNKKVIFHQTVIDPCRYGGELHECYLFRCKVSDYNFIGAEHANFFWAKKKGLKNLDLIPNAKIVFSRINFLENNREESIVTDNKINRTANAGESSIIDCLPLSIVVYNKKNKPSFTNIAAEKFLYTMRRQGIHEYNKFTQFLAQISKKSIEDGSNASGNIQTRDGLFNIIANPLLNDRKTCGSTVTIKDITKETNREAYDVLAYRTSMALGADSSFNVIIKNILKQTFSTMDIDGASLMLLEQGILKVSSNYSTDNSVKHQPCNLKIGEGVAGWVVKNKAPLAIPNTGKNSMFVGAMHRKNKSLLSVPVSSRNKILGVLNLTKTKDLYFTEEETKTASIIANRIAQALENEMIYKQLSNERKTFETVLKTTTDGLIMVDKNFKLIFANDAAIKMLPLRKKDLLDHTVENYLAGLSSENSNKLKKYITDSIKLKKSFDAEFFSHKGSEKIVKARFNPVIEKNNFCDSVQVGFTNTTKLVKKQRTVTKQVKQLAELFKISSLSINSTSLFFNSVLKKTAGILDSELAELYFFNQNSNEDKIIRTHDPEITHLMKQILKQNSLDREFICNDAKNHFKNITNISKIIIAPVKLKDQPVGLLYAINKEKNYNSKDAKWLSIIAERLASRIETTKLFDELQKDRQQIERIIDNSGDGIIVRNASNSEVIVWNKAMRQITGFETNAQCRKANPHIAQFVKDAQKEASENGDDKIYKELQYKNYDGEEQWMGVNFSFIKTEDKIDHIISNVRDISKDKMVEDRNKEFVYTTTHELRTPITAIKGYLSMILNGDAGEVNSKQKKYFNKVYQSTENLVSLVEDLLKTARIEEDKLVIAKEPFGLNAVAGDVINDFRSKAKSKGLNLGAMGWKGNIVVEGDPDKTKQALSNLVDNAIKYTTKGSVIIRIQKEDGFGKIAVEDTGVGIPKKEQESVFSKFYRVPNSESIRAGGTGLGLFIVKNLIEKQGGKIQVKSKLGKGTSISILLPLVVK